MYFGASLSFISTLIWVVFHLPSYLPSCGLSVCTPLSLSHFSLRSIYISIFHKKAREEEEAEAAAQAKEKAETDAGAQAKAELHATTENASMEAVGNEAELFEIFHLADTDCSGYIDQLELLDLGKAVNPNFTTEKCRVLLKKMDTSHDGKVSPREFIMLVSNFMEGLTAPQRDKGLSAMRTAAEGLATKAEEARKQAEANAKTAAEGKAKRKNTDAPQIGKGGRGGKGVRLLCLHGWSQNGEIFEKQARDLLKFLAQDKVVVCCPSSPLRLPSFEHDARC